jgi:5-methyltetrahydropteroyltriglutamate--homocysteine methyltransferase
MASPPIHGIGPGVYNTLSSRVPSEAKMAELLVKATKNLTVGQICMNPDCGLKTRSWEEVRPALVNMVAAAQALREDSSAPMIEMRRRAPRQLSMLEHRHD